MAMIRRFEDLEIWKLARVIFQKISKIADKMRRNHDFRFAEQIKSAAGSVMDNIAEGFERNSSGAQARQLSNSYSRQSLAGG